MSELQALIREADVLGENITLEFLSDAVRRLDASVPEGSTATFSSGTTPLNVARDYLAQDLVADLSLDSAEASGSARITHVSTTEVGRFLQEPMVIEAIEKADNLGSHEKGQGSRGK